MGQTTPTKKALISVSDKTGVADFAKSLSELGIEILSTGGTAKTLGDAGVAVTKVENVTGAKEILGGRVKTLHPAIHGGILGIRNNPEHAKQMTENGIEPIDIVVVNLYPFERTIAKKGVSFSEAIENIDIGGPAMVRAAAKNHAFVAVVTDPADYPALLEEIKNSGAVGEQTRLALARKAFALTARYDSAITAFFSQNGVSESEKTGGAGFPQSIAINLTKRMDLRYGENPHQKGAFYTEQTTEACVSTAKQIQGKELSLNNIYDTDSAFELVKEFDPADGVACVIVKHNNPCGVALGETPADAFTKAKQCDPVSAFGGIVALNREADEGIARLIAEMFVEVVIAPRFSEECVKILSEKENLRVLETPAINGKGTGNYDIKKVAGGALIQDRDSTADEDFESAASPTERKPSAAETADMRFAWKVCKHVKSNAIVFARNGATIGIGAGQMSRVDSVKLAAMKAQSPTGGCVMASDAFFPFRDGIDEAAKAGIKAVVHPGGSIRDEETTSAANEHAMAVLLTGVRHFKH
ncbi:MAG: bifunctional phosphoribosylaminoimidazolecarboxamide formyltransferase/IMP cyclohydrolase [Candidatus Mycalebacterium zealandia]|nr:MAG: bifunctional phosphoribosylaminoimidazolecarboxamide formyltransferase/IMP cyclohydrolase [Candidatus Mycalebacterium zealandia]